MCTTVSNLSISKYCYSEGMFPWVSDAVPQGLCPGPFPLLSCQLEASLQLHPLEKTKMGKVSELTQMSLSP